jgi:hypothetical protein
MAKFRTDDLLEQLKNDVQRVLAAAQFLQGADRVKMAYSKNAGQWSAIQAIEHLNMYGRYYIPAMKQAMENNPGGRQAWFQSGWLGNYFTRSMAPKTVYEVKNKMKTPKNYNPTPGLNVDTVLNEFIQQQNQLLQLLEQAKNADLGRIRIPITISKMVKMKLGDTFRFLIAHEQRHMIQARNALHATGVATDKFPVILQVRTQ